MDGAKGAAGPRSFTVHNRSGSVPSRGSSFSSHLTAGGAGRDVKAAGGRGLGGAPAGRIALRGSE